MNQRNHAILPSIAVPSTPAFVRIRAKLSPSFSHGFLKLHRNAYPLTCQEWTPPSDASETIVICDNNYRTLSPVALTAGLLPIFANLRLESFSTLSWSSENTAFLRHAPVGSSPERALSWVDMSKRRRDEDSGGESDDEETGGRHSQTVNADILTTATCFHTWSTLSITEKKLRILEKIRQELPPVPDKKLEPISEEVGCCWEASFVLGRHIS